MNINNRYIRDNNIVAVKPFEKLDIIHRHFECFQQARKILNVCMFDCVSNEINMDVYRKALNEQFFLISIAVSMNQYVRSVRSHLTLQMLAVQKKKLVINVVFV